MGQNFFEGIYDEQTSSNYDDFIRGIYAGYRHVGGDNIAYAIGEDHEASQNSYKFLFQNADDLPLAKAGDIYDFGALRAAMFAYNSMPDKVERGERGASVRAEANMNTGKVPGSTPDETGVYYIKGPYWWGVQNIYRLSNGFGSDFLNTLEYRDPNSEERRQAEKSLQLLDNDKDPLTLSALITMLTENTTVFGENQVELTEILGEEGIARYDAFYEALIADDFVTTAIEELVAEAPSDVVSGTFNAPTISIGSAVTITAAEAGEFNAPSTPTAGLPDTPDELDYGSPEVIGAASPGTATPDTVSFDNVEPGDLTDVAAGTMVDTNIEVTEPTLSSTGIEPTNPATSYVAWSFDEEDLVDLVGSLPTLDIVSAIASPTEQSIDAAIDDAVSAFSDALDLRYADEEAKLRRSLASSRRSMTSAFDRAQAILNANKQAQINEYEKSLRIQQAQANLQAGIRHQELLLQRNQRNEELKLEQASLLERLKLEYYNALSGLASRYHELAVRDAQFKTDLDAKVRQFIADIWTKYNIADADNQLKARTSTSSNHLQFQSTQAQLETQTNIATQENYLRALLAAAENMLRASISDVENAVRVSMANAEASTRVNVSNSDRAAQLAIAAADNLTKASMTAGELAVRANIAGAENVTRVSLANAENILKASMAVAENVTRVNMANLDADTRAKLSHAENYVRAALAEAEMQLKTSMSLHETATRVDLANQDMALKVALANQDMEFRRAVANNERIINELNFRIGISRMISEVTLNWMGQKTSNAGALSHVITTAMQKHTQETLSRREFDMNAEINKWQILTQRSALMEGIAKLKWQSQIQNLTVMQQTLASIGQANGTQHTPSLFQQWMTPVSAVANLISSGIGLGVALH